MANLIYPKQKEYSLRLFCAHSGATIPTGVLSAILVDKGVYSYSATHEFVSSIGSGVVGTPAAINSPTFTNGILDGGDSTFVLPSGPSIEAIAVAMWTGVQGTSRLLCFIDTGISGLPFTPTGSNNYVAVWGAYIVAT